MGRRKGFKHTEEVKEKLRIARQKYLEKNGTLLNISEKDNPQEYMRLYQRRWRERTPGLSPFKIQEKEFDCEGRNDKA